jgi:tripartite-type tricarboxylate transporter receptor subunit TctC
MTNIFKSLLIVLLALYFSLGWSADKYPSKPIAVIVPFPAGGPLDQTIRLLGPKMTASLGQPIIIDNKGGAAGLVGANAVAKASPNGYTLLFSSVGALAIVPNIASSMPYNPQKDLDAITQVVKVPTILVVASTSKYETFGDLLNDAKANPEKINYASAGSGTNTHLAAELLKREAKINVNHVPYRGAAPAITDLLGGQVEFMIADAPVVLPFIKDGKLRALAVTSAKRIPVLSGTPTTAELGYPKVEVYNWYGMLAPSKTPKEIIDRLYLAVKEAAQSPELKTQFADQGIEVVTSKPSEFGPFILAETARWGALARSVGAKLE